MSERRPHENLTRTITTLKQALTNGSQYNIAFGNVYATSGVLRMLPETQGRSDWAIMSITNPTVLAKNQVSKSSLWTSKTALHWLRQVACSFE